MPNPKEGYIAWLTGLSGAGKSTISDGLRERLTEQGRLVFLLDGDAVRMGLNADLGFSDEDRAENIRRVAEVAALIGRSGSVVIVALISPLARDRARARAIAEKSGVRFYEIHLAASLEVCEKRDPKGLYRRARAGEIPKFTGIDSAYEAPEHPDIALRTGEVTPAECLESLMAFLAAKEATA